MREDCIFGKFGSALLAGWLLAGCTDNIGQRSYLPVKSFQKSETILVPARTGSAPVLDLNHEYIFKWRADGYQFIDNTTHQVIAQGKAARLRRQAMMVWTSFTKNSQACQASKILIWDGEYIDAKDGELRYPREILIVDPLTGEWKARAVPPEVPIANVENGRINHSILGNWIGSDRSGSNRNAKAGNDGRLFVAWPKNALIYDLCRDEWRGPNNHGDEKIYIDHLADMPLLERYRVRMQEGDLGQTGARTPQFGSLVLTRLFGLNQWNTLAPSGTESRKMAIHAAVLEEGPYKTYLSSYHDGVVWADPTAFKLIEEDIAKDPMFRTAPAMDTHDFIEWIDGQMILIGGLNGDDRHIGGVYDSTHSKWKAFRFPACEPYLDGDWVRCYDDANKQLYTVDATTAAVRGEAQNATPPALLKRRNVFHDLWDNSDEQTLLIFASNNPALNAATQYYYNLSMLDYKPE